MKKQLPVEVAHTSGIQPGELLVRCAGRYLQGSLGTGTVGDINPA